MRAGIDDRAAAAGSDDERRTTGRQGTTAWHAMPVEDVLGRLNARPGGLAQADADRRLREQGANRLSPPKRRSAWRRLVRQFANALVLVLVGAAVVMLAIGEWLDATVVGAVVAVNALIGFVQEGRAERALEAVREAVSPQAAVLRDGERRQVAAESLVTGDVVCLKAGDVVPADLRLTEVRGLEAQEAALTGESAPVAKSVDPVAEEAALGDRTGMAYAGASIARGGGQGVVAATGDATEIGRIGRMLATSDEEKTPLSQQLDRFSRRLTVAILVLATAVFGVGAGLRGLDLVEMFGAAVGLAIAAVPEALPAILTITMAVGVTRMARRKAIVRKLPAVETLGSVDVICADKTGTLTSNQLVVRSATTGGGRFEVEGDGYAPEGAIRRAAGGKGEARDDPLLRALACGALLASDASIRQEGEEWRVEGDLTDGALVVFAAKAGLEAERVRGEVRRLDAIPYEADRQYMATLAEQKDGRALFLKGAPERILGLCGQVATAEGDAPLDREAWNRTVEDLAGQGQRLLAVARKAGEGDKLSPEAIEAGGFTLLGLVGMIDPARPEVAESIDTCRKAGIEVKMITGDHAVTARAIGASLGLEGEAITGPELDRLDDRAFADAARDRTIVARATPEHKQRLIDALRAQDKTIAMTGDGFNDAPALQKADVGVAMGGRGTQAAREAADMVLTDDNFASIVAAVHEGRTVYDNVRKAILYILPTSFGEAGLIVLAVLLGQALPITALQILWVNLVTEVTLSVSIAFDPPEPDIMTRPPHARGEPLLSRFLAWRVAFVAGLMTLGGWLLFTTVRDGGSVEEARTMVVNGLVAFEIAYLFNCRRLRGSSLGTDALFGNRVVLLSIAAVVALQILFTYAGVMQRLFGTAPLALNDWAMVALPAAGLFLLVELEKWFTRRRARGQDQGTGAPVARLKRRPQTTRPQP